MSMYEDGGSMKGSGIDSFEFEYGNFTCKSCLLDNYDAIAYGNDWSYWEVTCEECDAVHDSGTRDSQEEPEWY